MTRKDYALLADAIRNVRGWDEDELEANVSARVTYAIADALASDNPRFDRDRFLLAVGRKVWKQQNERTNKVVRA